MSCSRSLKWINIIMICLTISALSCQTLTSQAPKVEATTTVEISNYNQGHILLVNSSGDIILINPDLSEIKTLVSGPDNTSPGWSPDGKQIVYIHKNFEIWIYDIDSQSDTMVYQESQEMPGFPGNPEGILRLVKWADDDSGIYFHGGGGGPSWNHIKCLDRKGHCKSLYLWGSPNFDVSKDNRIVYMNFSNAARVGFGLSIYDTQTTVNRELIQLLPGKPDGPSWSPDGKRVALYTDGRLVTIASNGRDQRTITNAAPVWIDINPPKTSWSPDGEFIAYENQDYIWVIASNGQTSPIQIISGTNPSWGQ